MSITNDDEQFVAINIDIDQINKSQYRSCKQCGKGNDEKFIFDDGYHYDCRTCKVCYRGNIVGGQNVMIDGYHYDCRTCKGCGLGKTIDGQYVMDCGYHYNCRLCKKCGLGNNYVSKIFIQSDGCHKECSSYREYAKAAWDRLVSSTFAETAVRIKPDGVYSNH
jgi:hypothetical protein